MRQIIETMQRQFGNIIARGIVSLVNSTTKMQGLQVRLLSGEAKDDVEHFEPYGFTSHPKSGAEHITLFMDGDRSHGVTIVCADRRYRLTGLAEGEVALHDDQGQAVQLKRAGIVVDAPLGATINGNVQIVGTLTASVDVVAGTVSLGSHVHGGVTVGGGNTSWPI